MNRSCEYFEQLISNQADSPLSAAEQAELRTHLATCAHCREFQSSVERSSELLKSLPIEKVNAPLNVSLSQSVRPGPLQRIWRSHITLPAPLAAAALLIIIGFSVWMATRHTKTPVMPPSKPTAEINYVQVEQIAPGSGTPIPAPRKP